MKTLNNWWTDYSNGVTVSGFTASAAVVGRLVTLEAKTIQASDGQMILMTKAGEEYLLGKMANVEPESQPADELNYMPD
jgi:hypothetical protein